MYRRIIWMKKVTRSNPGWRYSSWVTFLNLFFLGVTCKQPISAQSKISMIDSQPCCVNCYEDKHAKRCSRCQKAIIADVEYLEFEDKYWHKECFTCSKCQVNSLKKIFVILFLFFSIEMYCRRKFLSRWKFNFMQRLHLIIKKKKQLLINFFVLRILCVCVCVCFGFENYTASTICLSCSSPAIFYFDNFIILYYSYFFFSFSK
jgi:hypothetical protein